MAGGLTWGVSATPGRSCYWPRALLHVALRNPLPAATRTLLWAELAALTPEVEYLDERGLTLDITHAQRRHGAPELIARRVHAVLLGLGARGGVGVAGDGLAARIAAAAAGDGPGVIAPWEARTRLQHWPLARTPGLAPRLLRYLQLCGAHTLGALAELPPAPLIRRFGLAARQLCWLAQGRNPEAMVRIAPWVDALSYNKVLPPHTHSRRTIAAYLRRASQRLAQRLRQGDYEARQVDVSLRPAADGAAVELSWALAPACVEAAALYAELAPRLLEIWPEQAMAAIEVRLSQLERRGGQLELPFAERRAPDDATVSPGRRKDILQRARSANRVVRPAD